MECLSKRSDYDSLKEPVSLVPQMVEEKSFAKTLVTPLELPRAEKCTINSVRIGGESGGLQVQKVNNSEDKQHPSRS